MAGEVYGYHAPSAFYEGLYTIFHPAGSCRPAMANPCHRGIVVPWQDVMRNIMIKYVDETSFKSFILKRWFTVRWCPERPLGDQFQVAKKNGQQGSKNPEHRMDCKGKGGENNAGGEDQNWQDMILLTQAIEQVTTSC